MTEKQIWFNALRLIFLLVIISVSFMLPHEQIDTIFPISHLPRTGQAYASTQLQVQVAASADDATEQGDGTFNAADSTWGIRAYSKNPPDASADYKCFGVRFTLNIAKGSTITAANMTFNIVSTSYDDPEMTIYGNLVADADNFTDNASIIDRPRTSASVAWSDTALGTGWVSSPDITTVIQELVNQASWTSGNAIVLLGIASGTQSYDYFIAREWDYSDHTYGTKLNVEYNVASTQTETTANFTQWAETDNSSDITVAATQITVSTMAANIESHVENTSVSYSGNFSIDFRVNVQSGFGSNAAVGWFMLSEGADTITEAEDANSGLQVYTKGISEHLWFIDENTGDSNDFGVVIGSDVYFTITRNATTATLYIYSDSGRTTLTDSAEITCATTTYNTVVTAYSYDSSSTDSGTGYIYDFYLNENTPFVTASESSIGSDNATLSCMVYGIMGSSIDTRGFEWGYQTSGNYTSNWTEDGTWGEESFSHQITSLAGGAVYYRAFAVNDGGYIGYSKEGSFNTYEETNPIVDNTTSLFAVRMPHEERIFYTQGRWWLFYGAEDNDDETDPKIKWKTSTDNGTTWSSATTIRDSYRDVAFGNHGGAGFGVTLASDGSFHYSYSQHGDLFYRRGEPQTDGSISWTLDESNLYSPSSYGAHSTITTNSTGHPWIAYLQNTSVNATSSSTLNGTWTDTGGSIEGNDQNFFIVPMNSGRMYLFEDVDPMEGNLYDGSSWQASEGLELYPSGYPISFSAVPDGDDIYLVSQNGTDHVFMKRTYGVGWSAPETIAANVTSYSSPVMCLLDNSQLLIIWAGGEGLDEDHKFYYRVGSPGSWGSVTELQDESVNTLNRHDDLTISRFEEDAGVGFAYGINGLQPYQVLFMHIDPTTLTGYDAGGGWSVGNPQGITVSGIAYINGADITTIANVNGQ